jgi:hypothetical protein
METIGRSLLDLGWAITNSLIVFLDKHDPQTTVTWSRWKEREPQTKRYGEFQTGDRVVIGVNRLGFTGQQGTIEDLNETVAAVRFSPRSAATFYLTDLTSLER